MSEGSIFLTGGTGYLGSYVIAELVARSDASMVLMTRAKDRSDAIRKLWDAMQLHWSPEQFAAALPRIAFVNGDLEADQLGLSAADRARVIERCDTILHGAASLNRKSSKACFNANLRGTLSMINLAREFKKLRRFSFVSTSAVSGQREHEVVGEDESIDWSLSDYDPYGRTKKFCEHMIGELLPDVPTTIFRPSTVMGDPRFAETTQFEMVRIYCLMADAPAIPVHPDTRLDFVPANFVGEAIARLHLKEAPEHRIYHLTAGEKYSQSAREHIDAMRAAMAGWRGPRLMPRLMAPFERISDALASGPRGGVSLVASLIKVFLPYFTNDVVFANERVTEELGIAPARFTTYGPRLYQWSKSVDFKYPYRPLPAAFNGHSLSEAAAV